MRTLLLSVGVVLLLGCPVPSKLDGGGGGGGSTGGGAATGGGGGAATGGGGGAATGGGGGGGGGVTTGGGGGGCATGLFGPDGGCVECLPSSDTCGAHQYCTSANTCAPGCKSDSACESQRCLPNHDCFECLSDAECGDGRVCGTGVCSAPCTGTCAGGTCCSGRCVDLARDDAHCGACGNACTATSFCDGVACRPALVANFCEPSSVVVVLDGLGDDDDAGARLATMLSTCAPPVPTSFVAAADAGALFDLVTGEPWVHGGAALGLMGGPFGQPTVAWLERTGATQVRFSTTATDVLLTRQDGGVIVQAPFERSNASHDWFVLELVKDPQRGSASLVGYGFSGAGTLAGAFYLANQVWPTRSAWTKAWYIVEWTDVDTSGTPSVGDSFTPVASGP